MSMIVDFQCRTCNDAISDVLDSIPDERVTLIRVTGKNIEFNIG